MEEADLVAAGVLDPSAPDAEERRALFAYLAEQGATVPDVVAAEEARSLHSLGLDLRLRRGELSASDLAEAIGRSVEEVVEVYRVLGVPVADVHERRFSREETDLLVLAGAAAELLPDGMAEEILRAVGTAMALIAESEVSAFVGSVEDVLEAGGDLRSRAEATVAAGELALEVGDQLGALLRHHLVSATDRQRAAMFGAPDRRQSTFTVGFVDLVGFTTATGAMSHDELLAFMREFHGRTYDVVSGRGGRVVKHIGDEIMFAATDAATGCDIALALLAAFSGDAPPRGGLATGTVLARHGDLYGSVVNLAARLADVAVSGEVLADAAVAAAVGDATHLVFEPAGRRQLKGFDEPVAVVAVTPQEHP